MKFEDFLMQRGDDHQKPLELESEVVKLQGELDEEVRLKGVLRRALQRPIHQRPFLSPLLPLEVQVLLAEVAMVEEEIMHLERRILELKLHLDEEKKHTKEWELHHDHQQKLLGPRVEHSPRLLSLPPSNFRSQRHIRDRKPFLGFTTADIKPMSSASFNGMLTRKIINRIVMS